MYFCFDMQQDNFENTNRINEPIVGYSGEKKVTFYESFIEQKEYELLHELQMNAIERIQTTVALIRKIYSDQLKSAPTSNRITFIDNPTSHQFYFLFPFLLLFLQT